MKNFTVYLMVSILIVSNMFLVANLKKERNNNVEYVNVKENNNETVINTGNKGGNGSGKIDTKVNLKYINSSDTVSSLLYDTRTYIVYADMKYYKGDVLGVFPYYSENGKLCKYDPETNTISEIE